MMQEYSKTRFLRVCALGASLLVGLFLVFITQNITSAEVLVADFTDSTISVNKSEATPGSEVSYTIVVTNSAAGLTDFAFVEMTNTLPTDVELITSSLNASTGAAVASSGVITWAGLLNAEEQSVISYDVKVSEALTVGDIISNSFEITADGVPTSSFPSEVVPAVVNIVESSGTTVYIPVLSKPAPDVFGFSSTRPSNANTWTLSWIKPTQSNGVTGYEVQESLDPAFLSGASTISIGDVDTTTLDRVQPLSPNNVFYYRVRSIADGVVGNWSDPVTVVGGYRDDFVSTDSGWRLVRQDTDDVSNNVYYTPEGTLRLRIDGRWDYLVASSLATPPEPPYRIETQIQLLDHSNLHSYGIVFGGDSIPGQPCPATDYSTCFNVYNRLLSIWHGAPNSLTTILKRIEFHDERNNAARGPELAGRVEATVNVPPESLQTWVVEVYPDGRIIIAVNGNVIYNVVDNPYVLNPHFGFFAGTDEYGGLDADVQYIEVRPID